MQRRQVALVPVAVILGFLFVRSGQAQFVKIDDFETYTLGPIDGQSDDSGIWNAQPTHEVVVEPNSFNKVLNAAASSPETNAFNTDPKLTLADGAIGTLFFRIQRGTDVVGHIVYGLSDVASPGAWGDFEASMGDRSQPREIDTGTLEVRNAGSYIPLDHDIEPNEWINLWMVIDNDFDTFEVYAQSDTTYPEQTLLDDDTGENIFDFRNGTDSPLLTFLMRTGTEHASPFYLDDIYVDASGQNLVNPITEAEPLIPGDFNGDGSVDIADFNILADNFGEGRTFAEGDFDFNGTVDLNDFVGFRQAYNEAQGQAAVVPEPTGLSLLVLTLLGYLPRNRKRSPGTKIRWLQATQKHH